MLLGRLLLLLCLFLSGWLFVLSVFMPFGDGCRAFCVARNVDTLDVCSPRLLPWARTYFLLFFADPSLSSAAIFAPVLPLLGLFFHARSIFGIPIPQLAFFHGRLGHLIFRLLGEPSIVPILTRHLLRSHTSL